MTLLHHHVALLLQTTAWLHLYSSLIHHHTLKPLFRLPHWRGAGAGRCREARLHVHLLHAVCLFVERIIALVKILDVDTVCDHLERVNLALLDTGEQVLPVEVDGCLAIADKADTALHERAWERDVNNTPHHDTQWNAKTYRY